jgi:hypothetical protein
MSRVLSTHVFDNLGKKEAHPVFLLEMELGSHNYHYWTGRGDAGTYKADGTILELSDFNEKFGLQAESFSVRVGFKDCWIDSNGVERVIDLSDVSLYRGKTIKLMLNYETTSSAWLANPSTDAVTLFEGTITEIESYISTDESFYQVTAESQLINLNTNKVVRYSNQDQLNKFSGDVGLEYARQAQSSLLVQRGQEVPETLYSRKIIYGEHKQDGDCVFASISGTNGEYLNLVYVFADHEIQSFEQVYLDDRQVWETGTTTYHSNFNPDGVQLVNVYTKTGTDNQTSISELTTEVTSAVWGTNHRLRGIAYIYVRLQYETETFGDEIPRCSALIKGKKVFDPRTSTTAYSDNPALCLRDFLADSEYSLGATSFSDTHFTSSANACDDLVNVTLDGVTTSEKRFTCSAVLDSANKPSENINILLSSFAGDIVYSSGSFHVHAGVHQSSVIDLSFDDIFSEVDSYNRNYRDVFNKATGLYVDPEIDYRQEEYPPFELTTAEESDERRLTLDLPATNKTTECQRIAKIAIKESRQVKHLTFKTGLEILKATVGDNITITTGISDIDGLYKIHNINLTFDGSLKAGLDLLSTASTDYDFADNEYQAKPTISTEPDSSVIDWVNAKLPKPVFSHTSANFTVAFDLSISFDNSVHTCRFTTDGSVPTRNASNSATQTYSSAITIPTDIDPTPTDQQVFTIKALVYENSGSLQSDVASVSFTYIAPVDQIIAPVSQPAGVARETVNVGHKKIGGTYITGINHQWKIPTGNVAGATTGLTLNYSVNGGSNYSTTTVNEGDQFNVPISSGYNYNNMKAYLSKAGYVTSSTSTATGKPFIMPVVYSENWNVFPFGRSTYWARWYVYTSGTIYVTGTRNNITYSKTINKGFGGFVDESTDGINYNGFQLARVTSSSGSTSFGYTCRAYLVTSDGRVSDTIRITTTSHSAINGNLTATFSYANEGGGSG